MNKLWKTGVMLSTCALLAAGCGKPPAGAGGPPGEYSVSAIVAVAQPREVVNAIQLVGSLKAMNAVEVSAEINGTVSEIAFIEGATVKRDDVLIRLDDTKLNARLAEAAARYDLARTDFERARELLASQTISQQEYDRARAEHDAAEAAYNLLKEEVSDTVIRASFAGMISARLVSPGQYVSAGKPLTRLVQMDPLEAEFRVPETYLARLSPGQEIVMRSPALPDRPIKGSVFFIDPIIDPQSRTVLVKAKVDNRDLQLKPGLFGTLELVLGRKADSLVVPESAVKYSGDQASVVLVNAEGRAEFRTVTAGIRMPGEVEIVDGLQAGDRVVVEGFQKMGPGTMIIIAPGSEKYGATPTAPAN